MDHAIAVAVPLLEVLCFAQDLGRLLCSSRGTWGVSQRWLKEAAVDYRSWCDREGDQWHEQYIEEQTELAIETWEREYGGITARFCTLLVQN